MKMVILIPNGTQTAVLIGFTHNFVNFVKQYTYARGYQPLNLPPYGEEREVDSVTVCYSQPKGRSECGDLFVCKEVGEGELMTKFHQIEPYSPPKLPTKNFRPLNVVYETTKH